MEQQGNYFSDGICGIIHYFGVFLFVGSKFFPFPKRRVGLSLNTYFGVIPYTARLYFLNTKKERYLVHRPTQSNTNYSSATTIKNYNPMAFDVRLGLPILVYSADVFKIWITPNIEACFRQFGHSSVFSSRAFASYVLAFGSEFNVVFCRTK
jgi:hypothetical protein